MSNSIYNLYDSTADINALPHELLEIIFKYLPSKDLLKCRRLCHQWKQIASPICRNRYVELNLNWFHLCNGNLDNLIEVYQDLDNLPWSSTILTTSQVDPHDTKHGETYVHGPLSKEDTLKFVQVFGVYIRQLIVYYEQFLAIMLQSAPNLKQLYIHLYSLDRKDVERMYDDFPVNNQDNNQDNKLPDDLVLAKLCKINIYLHEARSFRLLEQILPRTTATLNKISISYDLDDEDTKELSDLISAIPKISLKLDDSRPYGREYPTVNKYKGLCGKNLKVQKLSLVLPYLGAGESYLPLETFLWEVAGNLEKFEFKYHHCKPTCLLGRDTNGELKPRFQIPVLPELKYLKFDSNDRARQCGDFEHLIPFAHNQFPKLEDVTLGYSKDLTRLFNGICFENVLTLELQCSHDILISIDTDWIEIFPNLRILSCHRTKRQDFNYIFAKMPQLEQLFVTVDTSYNSERGWIKEEGDINVQLTGISNPEEFEHASEEKIREERRKHELPSIINLNNLKTLVMDFGQLSKDPLRNSAVNLALLQIQPLDYLCLNWVELSVESISKLQAYHRRFEQKTEFSILRWR